MIRFCNRNCRLRNPKGGGRHGVARFVCLNSSGKDRIWHRYSQYDTLNANGAARRSTRLNTGSQIVESTWSPNRPVRRFGVHLASKSGQAKSFVFSEDCLQVIDISCLGCKRSRVQIPAARPKSLKELQTADSLRTSFWSPSGVQNGRRPHGLSSTRKKLIKFLAPLSC